MPSTPHPTELRQRRFAVFAVFALPGATISSWVVRTPAIRDSIRASTEEMGLVLFGVSVGAMLGIAFSAKLVARFGARAVTAVGMSCCTVLSMPAVGVGADVGSGLVVALGLFLFGGGMGVSEVAINVEGTAIEREMNVPVLPSLHGCFSLGTVAGALAGVYCNVVDFRVIWHLVLLSILSALVLALEVRHLSASTGKTSPATSVSTAPPEALWRDRRLVLVGSIALAMALAEGAAIDWLPLIMVDGHGLSAAMGSVVFAAFAASMAVGRFAGGWFLGRFGRTQVFRCSAIAGALGMGCVIFVPNPFFAGSAVVLWGLGVSLGFPVAMSAAAESGADSASRVSLVATMGYVALLVGPPSLGFIGEAHGLRLALLAPLSLAVLSIALAPALQSRRLPADAAPPGAIVAAGKRPGMCD